MRWSKSEISYKNIYGGISSRGSNLLTANCSVCDRKKSITVSDNKIQAERLGSFFKESGGISAKLAKK